MLFFYTMLTRPGSAHRSEAGDDDTTPKKGCYIPLANREGNDAKIGTESEEILLRGSHTFDSKPIIVDPTEIEISAAERVLHAANKPPAPNPRFMNRLMKLKLEDCKNCTFDELIFVPPTSKHVALMAPKTMKWHDDERACVFVDMTDTSGYAGQVIQMAHVIKRDPEQNGVVWRVGVSLELMISYAELARIGHSDFRDHAHSIYPSASIFTNTVIANIDVSAPPAAELDLPSKIGILCVRRPEASKASDASKAAEDFSRQWVDKIWDRIEHAAIVINDEFISATMRNRWYYSRPK